MHSNRRSPVGEILDTIQRHAVWACRNWASGRLLPALAGSDLPTTAGGQARLIGQEDLAHPHASSQEGKQAELPAPFRPPPGRPRKSFADAQKERGVELNNVALFVLAYREAAPDLDRGDPLTQLPA